VVVSALDGLHSTRFKKAGCSAGSRVGAAGAFVPWLAGLLAMALAIAARADVGSPIVLVVGDSLSAAYGFDLERGWVALLQARLRATGLPHRVVNASISGDTTRSGRGRLPAELERHRPALVMLQLGGNDGLRGVPIAESEGNLAAMIEAGRAAGAQVLLVGIRLPPNYGASYTEPFRAMFPRLAARYGVPLVPFLLEGVAGDREWMQDDGIHPRAEAQSRLLENVWGLLQGLLLEDAPARAALPEDHPLNGLPAAKGVR
jgi:acyl-CoA thioesterase-1